MEVIVSGLGRVASALERIAGTLEKIEKKLPDRSCENQPGVDVNDFVSMLEKGLQDELSLRNQD